MGQPLRFIHAADLHLELPPLGLTEVPDHLRTLLIDAPFRAAERVFDAALKEHVDFLLLAGDVINPLACGPRGLVFLADQFERLAAQSITVYWAGGPGDDFERWLDAWPLPKNVVRFSLNRVTRFVHTRGGEPLAQILGTSSTLDKKINVSEFRAAAGELFAIGVAHGIMELDSATWQEIDYWALGGEHDRRTLASGPITAHYCGTCQGRSPAESGPRGCTLVTVDESRQVRSAFIETDAVRFEQQRLAVSDFATADQLATILGDRLTELTGDPFGPGLLISWTLSGSDNTLRQLRHGHLATDLVGRLRAAQAQKRPVVWTISVGGETIDVANAELLAEESVLGEFLRTVAHYAEHAEAELSLEPFLAERHLAGTLAAELTIAEPSARRRLLAQVAELGSDLLGPQESA